jgi:hypothetical protein
MVYEKDVVRKLALAGYAAASQGLSQEDFAELLDSTLS